MTNDLFHSALKSFNITVEELMSNIYIMSIR